MFRNTNKQFPHFLAVTSTPISPVKIFNKVKSNLRRNRGASPRFVFFSGNNAEYVHGLIIILALIFSLVGCRDKIPEAASTQESTAETEIKPYEDTIDWSTVTPEELWTGVSEVHDSEGPRMALLDRKSVV